MPTDTIKMMFRDLTMSIRASEEDDRVLIFRGTTESVASDGGILRAKGMDHKTRYKGNPVVKWNHGDEIIGRTIKLEFDAEAKAWDFHVQFPEPEVSEFADSRYRLAKAGFLRAASVGFKRDELEDLTDKKRQELGLDRYGWVAKRWTLHELSLVPVGADPMALQRSIEAGEFSQEDVDAEPPRNRKQTPEPIEPDAPTQDTRSITALEENTRAHQRTQAVMASLVDEIAGLRIDIAESGTGPESPHVPVAAPDDRSKEREQEERELKQRLDAFIAKYGDSK